MRDDLTRREAMGMTAGAGMLGMIVPGAHQQAQAADEVPRTEKDRVKAVGMTDGEADCWLAAAEAAGKFFALPELHPMDKQEVASAIHIIQNKLLSRPTYRKYLEEAKKQAEGKK